MSSLHIIRSNFSLVWDIVILSLAQDSVMQDATSKNKLYLSGESVEWFLVYLNLFFNAATTLSMVTLKGSV
jgi:hypothetical protein